MLLSRERARRVAVVFVFLLIATPARPQEPAGAGATQISVAAPNALIDARGTWDLGAFLGGGTGAGKSSDTQFLFAGGRGGLILSPDLFTGTPIRGNFEYAVEIMPVYTVFTPNGAVYGAS
ncbi:MAG TPA: hypothetical protein VGF20_12145, partial [Candidatus Acidoferrum sp.]